MSERLSRVSVKDGFCFYLSLTCVLCVSCGEELCAQRLPLCHPIFFASGQIVVTTSATKMPTETPRKRCHPVIHGACARGTSKIILSASAATRYAPPRRSTQASIPHSRIPEPYTKVLEWRKVAITIPTTAPSAVPTNRCQPKVIGGIVDCTITIAEIGAQ